jgi:hypothetical protein
MENSRQRQDRGSPSHVKVLSIFGVVGQVSMSDCVY